MWQNDNRLSFSYPPQDRDATVHLFEAYGGKDYLHYEGTLHRMSDYWGNKMHQKVDFRRGTYNIVTLMTE